MNTTMRTSNKFVIEGSLMGLNEYINLNRENPYSANKAKQTTQFMIYLHIRKSRVAPVENYPIVLKIDWYEKDNRRDVDNIIFAKKFILDALVESGVIRNDTRRYVKGFIENVYTDKEHPRVEVEICSTQQN